jgi:hypothetical protein
MPAQSALNTMQKSQKAEVAHSIFSWTKTDNLAQNRWIIGLINIR